MSQPSGHVDGHDTATFPVPSVGRTGTGDTHAYPFVANDHSAGSDTIAVAEQAASTPLPLGLSAPPSSSPQATPWSLDRDISPRNPRRIEAIQSPRKSLMVLNMVSAPQPLPPFVDSTDMRLAAWSHARGRLWPPPWALLVLQRLSQRYPSHPTAPARILPPVRSLLKLPPAPDIPLSLIHI